MSKRNYSKYANKKPVIKEETDEVVSTDDFVEETVETVALPEMVEGMVVNCARLNVRAEPIANAGVVCVLNSQSEINIDVAKSTVDWFYVYTATGVEGYCMRKFVEAHL